MQRQRVFVLRLISRTARITHIPHGDAAQPNVTMLSTAGRESPDSVDSFSVVLGLSFWLCELMLLDGQRVWNLTLFFSFFNRKWRNHSQLKRNETHRYNLIL